MKKSFQNHISVVLFLVALFILSGCQSLFFWPEPELVDSPDHFGFKYEPIDFKAEDDTQLHGWYLRSTLDDTKTIGTIYFLHGNGANLSYHITNLYWLIDYGWNIFIIDYRGYGWSQGKPDFKSVVADSASGYQWLLSHGETKVIVLGQSLGGAIAVNMLALNKDIKVTGLILDSTFDSHRTIFQEVLAKSWLFWSFQIPLSWAITDDYAPKKLIGKLSKTPTLIVHSALDKLISMKHSQNLYERADGVKSLWITAEEGHANSWQAEEWRTKLICQLEKWPDLLSAQTVCL